MQNIHQVWTREGGGNKKTIKDPKVQIMFYQLWIKKWSLCKTHVKKLAIKDK